MRRLRYYAVTAVAIAIGLGPGLALPFVLALRLSPASSDQTVLALSVATSLIGVVVPAVEARSIAVAGRLTSERGGVGPSAHHALVTSSMKWALPATILGCAGLGIAYSIGHSNPGALWVTIGIVATAPVLSSVSAVSSGILVSRRKTTLPIATQGLRAAIPLIAVTAVPGLTPPIIAACFIVGEGCRFVALSAARRRLSRTVTAGDSSEAAAGRADADGLPWQMGANAFGELNPVIARSQLTAYAGGTITAFELSEKVVSMSTQIAYNFGVLPRVGMWARATSDQRSRLFRRDTIIISALAASTSLFAIFVIRLADSVGAVPESWRLGLDWATVALFAGPAVAMTAGCVRLIAILGAQRALIGVVVTSVIANAACVGLFVAWLGPIGVVVTLVVCRYLLVAGLLIVIYRTTEAPTA